MAQTPEGRVKQKVKKILDIYREHIYYEMHVPGGYGCTSLDYLGSASDARGVGHAFAVEAKRPGGTPTLRQLGTIERMAQGGVRVFVIDGEGGLAELTEWLDIITGGHVL